MNIQKQILYESEGIYSTTIINLQGKQYLLGASENRGGKNFLFSPPDWKISPLWNEPGGVMNIVQIPGTERLLSITDFYPVFQSENAGICEINPAGDYKELWNIKRVLSVPFVHRIGMIKNSRGHFLISCGLCESKDYQDDWSKPGSIFISPIMDKDYTGIWPVKKIYQGLTKNHGLFIYRDNQVYIGAEEGIFLFDFSDYDPDKTIDPLKISEKPTSDIFIDDIDDDGYPEMGTIEPFHGDRFTLYRLVNNKPQLLYTQKLDFGHVIWTGKIFGLPSIITASRGGGKDLVLYQHQKGKPDNGSWDKILIDHGTGTTQISVFYEKEQFFIFAANHGIAEIALYTISS